MATTKKASSKDAKNNGPRNVGIEVASAPKTAGDDKNDPFFGNLPLRGKQLVGVVTSARMAKTVTVQWERLRYVPKYERYEKRLSKVKAHNPESIKAKEGDTVRIAECRPLSKTKNFVVIEVIQ